MADETPPADGWEYKCLEVRERQLLEDGQLVPTGRELRERSLELINDGWEPISASDLGRGYRRPRSAEHA